MAVPCTSFTSPSGSTSDPSIKVSTTRGLAHFSENAPCCYDDNHRTRHESLASQIIGTHRAAEPVRAAKSSAEQALTCRIRKIHQAPGGPTVLSTWRWFWPTAPTAAGSRGSTTRRRPG